MDGWMGGWMDGWMGEWMDGINRLEMMEGCSRKDELQLPTLLRRVS